VGDFQVAMGGGFWVAVGGEYLSITPLMNVQA